MIRNIPNILTAIRIILVPVFLFLVFNDSLSYAAAVFVFAGVTDAVDGFIAKRFDMRTDLGAIMDPFADKFLLTSSYLVLTYKEVIPLWLCVPVVGRDIAMIIGISLLKWAGRMPTPSPTIPGKLSTVMQTSTVGYALVIGGMLGPVPFTVLAAFTAAVTIYSGVHYAWRELASGR